MRTWPARVVLAWIAANAAAVAVVAGARAIKRLRVRSWQSRLRTWAMLRLARGNGYVINAAMDLWNTEGSSICGLTFMGALPDDAEAFVYFREDDGPARVALRGKTARTGFSVWQPSA
jgi:hypothetical protein